MTGFELQIYGVDRKAIYQQLRNFSVDQCFLAGTATTTPRLIKNANGWYSVVTLIYGLGYCSVFVAQLSLPKTRGVWLYFRRLQFTFC